MPTIIKIIKLIGMFAVVICSIFVILDFCKIVYISEIQRVASTFYVIGMGIGGLDANDKV